MTPVLARPLLPLLARAAVFAGIALLVALGWAYTVLMPDMDRTMAEMAAATEDPWSGLHALFTLLMWAAMMVAMMTPSALPMLFVYDRMARAGRGASASWRTSAFLLGYAAVWIGFSVVATLVQAGLHASGLLSMGMRSASAALNGLVLVAAGAYQLSPLKRACLAGCRSPLAFLLAEWRDGASGAFVMGLRHGLYCVGCCWLLMALLFVGGVMNVLWIVGLSVIVLLEKTLPLGRLAPALGFGLIAWGLGVLLSIGI